MSSYLFPYGELPLSYGWLPAPLFGAGGESNSPAAERCLPLRGRQGMCLFAHSPPPPGGACPFGAGGNAPQGAFLTPLRGVGNRDPINYPVLGIPLSTVVYYDIIFSKFIIFLFLLYIMR